jgi:hypothetical protein
MGSIAGFAEGIRLCLLVIVGVNDRGVTLAPQLAVGDEAMGLWGVGGDLSTNPRTAVLDTQDGQCLELPAQIGAA